MCGPCILGNHPLNLDQDGSLVGENEHADRRTQDGFSFPYIRIH